MARRLKELQDGGILERQAYNEIPPRVEYNLTPKGQKLGESVISLLQWMRKWSKVFSLGVFLTFLNFINYLRVIFYAVHDYR
jgi:hypothetical protein